MKKIMIGMWTFIALVVLVDVSVALILHKDFDTWEHNPIAVYLSSQLGIWVTILFRISTVSVGAILVCYSPPRTKWTASIIICAIHLYLAVVYMLACLCNPVVE